LVLKRLEPEITLFRYVLAPLMPLRSKLLKNKCEAAHAICEAPLPDGLKLGVARVRDSPPIGADRRTHGEFSAGRLHGHEDWIAVTSI
jgi:hypothetical protein